MQYTQKADENIVFFLYFLVRPLGRYFIPLSKGP